MTGVSRVVDGVGVRYLFSPLLGNAPRNERRATVVTYQPAPDGLALTGKAFGAAIR